MRYDDASQAGSTGHETVARPDVDTLAPGSYGPATGNAITGSGTNSGAAGADHVAVAPPKIVSVEGAGGQTVANGGAYQAAGRYGVLSMDADGNFSYVRNPGTPDGVKDVFNYTLADGSGANASTTLTIDIGQVAAAAAGQGVVSLPAGVELSDIHVNGRDLIINMPDGTQMVIPGGAVFVPEITIGDVQVPPTNLAALLIDSEPQPAAGPPTSSGGDWNDPVPPLDPGVPLGDLIPPTELTTTTPQFQPIFPGEHNQPTVVIETPDFPTGVTNASESVFEKGLPARGTEPAGSGEIADGNASNNSDPSETNTGTIVFTAQGGLQSVTVDGVAITQVGQTIQGQFGTMTITGINLNSGQITYSYTLADNTSGDTTADHFTVVVTDKTGDTATATLAVNIVDDVPTARNDTDATDDTSHVAAGNVITGAGTTSGSAGADTVGADNAHITAVLGAGGTDNSVDGSGNLTITGQFGTLVLNQNGSYTYTENANAPGHSVDTFTYTLTDGDGDTSTATLTITNPNHVPTVGENAVVQLDDDALAGGNPGGIDDGPDAVNTTGTLSGSGGDGQLTFALATSGAPTGFTYVSGPNGSILVQQVQDGHTVTVLTITVDAHTGAYTVTQNAPIDHAPGANENNADFTINYTVTDVDGDHANGSLNIQVNDDTPVVSLADVTTPTLTVDETNLGTDDTQSFAGSFSVSFGADGPATANSLVYSLGISASGADSGLIDTASGNHVFLFLENGQVVGREGTDATSAAGGPEVFTLTVDANGDVTLDQVRAVVQPNGTNPDTSEGVSLTSGDLVTLTATAADHDSDSASQTLNIGSQIVFQDDGPAISVASAAPSLTVDESDLSVNATASIAGIFSSSFGADGAGTITYALGISGAGADSGLIDTASGNHVFLFLENGVVVGREGADATAAAGGPEVFTVSIDASGNVTLDQIRAVVQPDGTSPDTSEGVTLSSEGLVTVTGTITDKDGDSSSATANIGQNLNFDDDGPTIGASGTVASVTVSETALNTPESSSFASAFTVHFGADGPAASNSISYTLGISSNGVDSGLIDTATGQHIFLVMNGSTVEGHVGSISGALAFTVTVDGSGDVTLDQLRAVVQPTGTNPDTGEGVSPLASTINLTATATDGDGDHASQSINIGDHLVFDDAGPTISAAATQPDLTVDETNLSVNATSSFATVFTSSFGADGAGTITYALGISASGADSGLIDTATGNHVFLFLENGQVVGREGADAGSAAGGPEVFTLTIDASGNVTLDQIRAVVQPLGTNGDTSEGVTLATDGLVTVTGTITDKDGDSATATASIGQNLHFNDDGPTASPDANSTAAGTTLTVTSLSTADVLHNDASGADGFASGGGVVGVAAGTSTSTALSTGVGTVIHGTFGDLTLNADGSYTYVAKPNVTGVDHFVYTIKDGDGDTSTTTLNITVNPVTAHVGDSATVVSEEVLLTGTEHGVTDTDGDAARDVLVNSGTVSLTDTISGATFTTGLTAPTGTFTSGGTTIIWTVSPDGHTLTGTAGTTTILTATIDNTGHYTVTLSGPIDTPNGGTGENGGDAVLNIGVTAHDNFGNTLTSGTLTVNVEDDAPIAHADVDSVTEDGPLVADGNVMTGIGGSDTNTTDGVADAKGADGATVTGVKLPASGTFTTVPTGTTGTTIVGAHGSLVIHADGSYTYTLNNSDTAVQALGQGQTTTDTFNYQITDGDGDKSSTTLTITINGTNDAPVVGSSTANVSEEGLTGANPDAVGSPTDTTNSVTATGTIGFTDVDTSDTHTVTLTAPANGSLKSDGFNVIWTGSGTNTLHAFQDLNGNGVVDAGEKAIMTITIDNAGNYTVTLQGPIDHPTANVEDVDSFGVTVNVSDGHTTSTGTLTVNVEDDSPVSFTPDPQPSLVDNGTASVTGLINDPAHNSTGVNFIGADGFGTLTFTGTAANDGTQLTDANNVPLTSHGHPILLTGFGTGTLTAYVESGATPGFQSGQDTVVFTATLNPGSTFGSDASYTIQFQDTIDNGSGVAFNNLTSTNAGNVDFRGVGTDSTAQPIDLLLSATSNGNPATVNTDSTSIGVGNQSLNVGDSVRIDFVSNLTSGTVSATDPTGFNFTGHDSSNGFVGLIPQVQGSQSATVDFTVWALNTTLTDTGTPDSNPTGGFSDGSSLIVTQVFAQDFSTGTTATVDISGVAVGDTVAVGSFGVTVTKNADGSVTFHGVQEGDHYGVTTSSDFNAIVIKDTGGSFDVGTFALSETQSGNPINLSLGVTAADADGDTSTGTITMTLAPTSGSAVVNNTLIHTQDIGHTALGTSSLIASNDNLDQQQQTDRVFSVGQTAALMGALAAVGLDAEHIALDGHHVALGVGDGPALTPLETASLASAGVESASVVGSTHVAQAMSVATGSAAPAQHSAVAHDMVEAAHPLAAAASGAPVPVTQLLHGSGPAGGHATEMGVSSMGAHTVVMPSAQQLAATGHGSPHPLTSVATDSAQHEQVVSKVLVDALGGGHGQGPTIDSLINSLPNHGGPNAVLHALADHGGAVSFGHMGFTTPFGSPHGMLTVEMFMQQHAHPAHG